MMKDTAKVRNYEKRKSEFEAREEARREKKERRKEEKRESQREEKRKKEEEDEDGAKRTRSDEDQREGAEKRKTVTMAKAETTLAAVTREAGLAGRASQPAAAEAARTMKEQPSAPLEAEGPGAAAMEGAFLDDEDEMWD